MRFKEIATDKVYRITDFVRDHKEPNRILVMMYEEQRPQEGNDPWGPINPVSYVVTPWQYLIENFIPHTS